MMMLCHQNLGLRQVAPTFYTLRLQRDTTGIVASQVV